MEAWTTSPLNSRVGRRVVGLFVSSALLPLAVLAIVALTHVSGELQEEAYRGLRRATKATGMTLVERLLILSTDLELAIDEYGRSGRSAFGRATPLLDRLTPRFRSLVHRTADGEVAPYLGDTIEIPPLSDYELGHLANNKTLVKTLSYGDRTEIALVRTLTPQRPGENYMVAVAHATKLWHAEGIRPVAGVLQVIGQMGQERF